MNNGHFCNLTGKDADREKGIVFGLSVQAAR